MKGLNKKPKKGALFVSIFETDYKTMEDFLHALDRNWIQPVLRIERVEHAYDTYGWSVACDDNAVYDCCWSNKFEYWIYNGPLMDIKRPGYDVLDAMNKLSQRG